MNTTCFTLSDEVFGINDTGSGSTSDTGTETSGETEDPIVDDPELIPLE